MQLLGDVQKLPDGYLAAWSSRGELTELDRDGNVRWQVQSELGTATGRITWFPDIYDLSGSGATASEAAKERSGQLSSERPTDVLRPAWEPDRRRQ